MHANAALSLTQNRQSPGKIQAKNRTQAAMWGINHQLPTPK